MGFLSLAEVGATVSADHLLQMATMPLEHKPTALGIPYSLHVSYQFDGAEESLQVCMHSLGSWRRPIPRGIGPKPPDLANNCAQLLALIVPISSPSRSHWPLPFRLVGPRWPLQESLEQAKRDRLRSYLPGSRSLPICDLALPTRRILQEGPLQSF